MSQASEKWWIEVNVAAVLCAFFRAELQTDWQRRALAVTVLPLVPTVLFEGGDAICSHCGHEIDPQICHCGEAESSHFEHSFVPMGCTCGYYDAPVRAVIPPIVPGTSYFPGAS